MPKMKKPLQRYNMPNIQVTAWLVDALRACFLKDPDQLQTYTAMHDQFYSGPDRKRILSESVVRDLSRRNFHNELCLMSCKRGHIYVACWRHVQDKHYVSIPQCNFCCAEEAIPAGKVTYAQLRVVRTDVLDEEMMESAMRLGGFRALDGFYKKNYKKATKCAI